VAGTVYFVVEKEATAPAEKILGHGSERLVRSAATIGRSAEKYIDMRFPPWHISPEVF
jgi:hypothetical protein